MNVNGKMIIRQIPTDTKIPKGKKVVMVVGVLVADQDVPDNHILEVDGPLNLGMKPVEMENRFNGWNIDDLVTQFDWNGIVPESTRYVEFHDLANKALKMVSHSTGSKKERQEMAALIRERAKELPELDIVKSILGSVVSVLGKE